MTHSVTTSPSDTTVAVDSTVSALMTFAPVETLLVVLAICFILLAFAGLLANQLKNSEEIEQFKERMGVRR